MSRNAGAMPATAQHTPGPWIYIPSDKHHGPYVTAGADWTAGDIADCYVMSQPALASRRNGGESDPIHMQGENADANARLIAAAPELLAAHDPDGDPCGPDFLDWLADRLVNVYRESPNISFVLALRRKAQIARAAIAKATGATV